LTFLKSRPEKKLFNLICCATIPLIYCFTTIKTPKKTNLVIQLKALSISGLTIPVPIIQGGMGLGISMSGLAAAVANEGGVGVISAAGLGLVHRNSALNFIEANIEGLKKKFNLPEKKQRAS